MAWRMAAKTGGNYSEYVRGGIIASSGASGGGKRRRRSNEKKIIARNQAWQAYVAARKSASLARKKHSAHIGVAATKRRRINQ